MKLNKLNPLILAAASLAGSANGATIASANFTGLSASGATVAASGTPGVNDFSWTRLGTTGVGTFAYSTPNVNIQTGTRNALKATFGSTVPADTFQGMIGTMSSSTTIPIGYTLTLSFIGQYTETPANNSGSLRFGFAQSGNLDNAFGLSVGTNGSNALTIQRDTSDGTPLGGGVVTVASGTGSQNITTSAYTASFAITRTDTGNYSYLGNINGSSLSAMGIAFGFSGYDTIFVRNGNTNADFQIDNVSVTLIPEPSTALLGGLGLLGLLRRRR